jgi:hypothetical protein
MKLFVLAAVLIFVSSVAAIPNSNGTCPPSPCDDIRLNVTVEQLEGIWYRQLSTPFPFDLNNTRCNYINHTAFGNNVMDFTESYRDE